jgi:hypothetical protein
VTVVRLVRARTLATQVALQMGHLKLGSIYTVIITRVGDLPAFTVQNHLGNRVPSLYSVRDFDEDFEVIEPK